ncbi:iron-siderophore ABC transporter substrate-binding protein [Dietzia sp. PP-33]|jgi:iron complex transport system substrate-binding protein|uniref:iron-siderophore ABC transporter substrate-binding protein n=1 Tax=Dietzia sp. PP-33 TaxID=2957500 RepID=UPI0029A7B036|nr:iron-siderophore ABC transporter substrate-binding protein [Dietzia sp. PP-33]MDX2357322.1 iron-siderophore ABC transporter substrate-binding protein [Dietzia sp. PP-33]
MSSSTVRSRVIPVDSPTRSRLVLILAAVVAVLAVLAGCTTGSAGGSGDSAAATDVERDGDFPRTITHAYGETEITEPPQRVATISWVNADVSLALGVVPVGMPRNSFGANAAGSTDWFDAELEAVGGEMPELYSETDGINTEAIAAVQPDLILGAYSGMTAEEYETLSKIAPTIAMPEGDVAFGTAWQDSTRLIGEALGRSERAEELVDEVEGQIAQVADDHPDIQGTTFVYGTVDPDAAEKIYAFTDVDNRPRFLEQLGMEQAPVVAEASTGASDQFAVTWSPERADELVSDILVTYAASPDVRAAIESDPLLGRIPAIQAGRMVLQTDEQQVLSISAASPLSLPWALENVVPDIIAAAEQN